MRKWLVAFVPLAILAFTAALVSCMQPEPAGAQAEQELPLTPPAQGQKQPDAPVKQVKPAGEEKPAEAPPAGEKKTPMCKSFFDNSLHATGEGMRYWYEEEGGFMQVTGIPYKDLGCKSCHADSCDKCHAEKEGDNMVFTLKKANKKETCLKCHARAGAAAKFDKKAGVQDVHAAAGLVCSDCHGGLDVHGDGKSYHSMRAPGAVKASCGSSDCHSEIDMTIASHSKHKDDIDCAACHVSSTITCLNCHFDNFLEVKKRVPGGNFFPGKSWTLLVNHEGKVTTGNAQTLVGKGKKFVVYVPYFTHSVIKEGRNCSACHGAEAALKMARGEAVEMATFKDGKVAHYSGVVPFIPDLIKWPWLDKDGDKWKMLESDEKPIVQKGCFVEPLTEKQLKKLKIKLKDK